MGPFAYNAHTNNLVLVLADICDIFNHAEDNTACRYGTSVQGALNKLNNAVSAMLTWFALNEMKVKGDKFQLIVFDRKSIERSWTFNVGESVIENQPGLNLVGLYVDSPLDFIVNIDICHKAGRKHFSKAF